MKKGAKVFLIILLVIIVLAAGFFCFAPKIQNMTDLRDAGNHRAKQQEAFSKLEYTVPAGYETKEEDPEDWFLPDLVCGDKDGLLSVIEMQAWDIADINMDSLLENVKPENARGGEIVKGPEAISVGGLEGKTITVQEQNGHFGGVCNYVFLASDEYVYKFTNSITVDSGYQGEIQDSDPCITGFDEFINSIKLK